jgi:hypothetical protein
MRGYPCIVLISIILLLLGCHPAFAEDNFKYGSKVLTNDLDESRALTTLTPTFGYWDAGTTGLFDPGDIVYVDFDSNGLVDENDLRLTPFGNLPAGSQVTKVDNDCGKTLTSFKPPAVPSYFDVYGDGAYSISDPVYLDVCPSGINANDIRITSYQGYAAGSRVKDSDSDNTMPTKVLPGVLSFYNTNGDINSLGAAVYGASDVVYLDVQLPFGTVTMNDIRMTI